MVHVQGDRYGSLSNGEGTEVNEKRRILQSPGEEEDLERRSLVFGGFDACNDCFRVVRHDTKDAVFAFCRCIEHPNSAIIGEF